MPPASELDPASPACALHLVDPAYSGLDEETLARARWRARRRLRRGAGLSQRKARPTPAALEGTEQRR